MLRMDWISSFLGWDLQRKTFRTMLPARKSQRCEVRKDSQ